MLLIPLPETPLAEERDYSVPDVILFDEAAKQTRIITEICNNRVANSDVRKIIRLIEEGDHGILEGFVYNYKIRWWLRCRKGDGGTATASSYPEMMHVEMGGVL